MCDAALLPWGGRHAEITGHAELISQDQKSRKFCPRVEGDALPEGRGQDSKLPVDASHDTGRMAGTDYEHGSLNACTFRPAISGLLCQNPVYSHVTYLPHAQLDFESQYTRNEPS